MTRHLLLTSDILSDHCASVRDLSIEVTCFNVESQSHVITSHTGWPPWEIGMGRVR